jgi:hypothetical protein
LPEIRLPFLSWSILILLITIANNHMMPTRGPRRSWRLTTLQALLPDAGRGAWRRGTSWMMMKTMMTTTPDMLKHPSGCTVSAHLWPRYPVRWIKVRSHYPWAKAGIDETNNCFAFLASLWEEMMFRFHRKGGYARTRISMRTSVSEWAYIREPHLA